MGRNQDKSFKSLSHIFSIHTFWNIGSIANQQIKLEKTFLITRQNNLNHYIRCKQNMLNNNYKLLQIIKPKKYLLICTNILLICTNILLINYRFIKYLYNRLSYRQLWVKCQKR